MVWGNNLKVESFEYQPRDFLEIYPTLSSGTVYIKSNDYKSAIKKVMVFSLNGILLQTVVNSYNSDLLTITIQKSGSYIIKVMGNDFEVNRKVIIQ
nr:MULTISPECIES: T9SS type A sorting domain-containing protein [unclassified Apibacter]